MHTESTRGFTLIELMVAIAVLAILAGLAAPSFNAATLNSRLAAVSNNFVASVALARSEAFKRNRPVSLCISTASDEDGNPTCLTSGDWEQGWVVYFVDSSSNKQLIQRQPAAPDGFKIAEQSTTTLRTITLSPTGIGATAATLTVCRTDGTQERVINITATGRTSITKTETGTCP